MAGRLVRIHAEGNVIAPVASRNHVAGGTVGEEGTVRIAVALLNGRAANEISLSSAFTILAPNASSVLAGVTVVVGTTIRASVTKEVACSASRIHASRVSLTPSTAVQSDTSITSCTLFSAISGRVNNHSTSC